MNVTISARHCEIPESLRAATEQRVQRLGRFDPRLAEAEVTYQRERAQHEAEIRLAVQGEGPLVARGSGASFGVALARTIDRVSRQLRRVRERRIAASPTPR